MREQGERHDRHHLSLRDRRRTKAPGLDSRLIETTRALPRATSQSGMQEKYRRDEEEDPS